MKCEKIVKFVDELLKKYELWEKEEENWNQKRFYAGAQIALKAVQKKIRRKDYTKRLKAE